MNCTFGPTSSVRLCSFGPVFIRIWIKNVHPNNSKKEKIQFNPVIINSHRHYFLFWLYPNLELIILLLIVRSQHINILNQQEQGKDIRLGKVGKFDLEKSRVLSKKVLDKKSYPRVLPYRLLGIFSFLFWLGHYSLL